MKQSSLIMKFLMTALLAGVLVYFGIYLVRSYQGGLSTVLAYEDTVNLGLQTTGVVVREETVLSNSAASTRIVDLNLSEGEKVAAGGVVATLYSTTNGLELQQQIDALESELEQLQYVLNSSGRTESAVKLDNDVLEVIAELRASTESGDLSDLEDHTLALRTLVFERDYLYGDANAADTVSSLIQQKNSELFRLRTALGSGATNVYAPRSGIFSGVSDGLESVLTPDLLDEVTPTRLAALQTSPTALDGSVMGKLITSSTWYFATTAAQESCSGLTIGKTYTVLFANDWSGEVEMTLERISDAEGGVVVLVFSCRTNLSDVTLLRRQTVEIVITPLSGLRIPRQALRALTETVTDAETGKTEEVTTLGVYAVVGATAEFKPVSVLYSDDDSYLVEPLTDPNTTRSDRAEAERLQAGDEIILSTSDLYDGKVVR